jgi:hypothetical protein
VSLNSQPGARSGLVQQDLAGPMEHAHISLKWVYQLVHMHLAMSSISLYVDKSSRKSGQPFRIRIGEHLNVESSFLLSL